MSKSSLISVAAAAIGFALALSAPIATAGLINNYNFNGGNANLGPSETFAGSVAGGPSVTVRGYLLTGSTWNLEEVSRNTNALGVDSDPGDNNDGQIGQRVEGLLFDLGSVFYGSFRLDFSQFTGADNADIWASATDIIANNFAGATQVANDSTSNPFTSGPMSFRYIFAANDLTPSGACAQGANQTTSNCFRVDNLQVVPEPGSLALVSVALVLAGIVRRRRSTK
jgi:hypothetical protein